MYDGYPQPADPSNNSGATPPRLDADSIASVCHDRDPSRMHGPALTSGHTYYWAVAADDQQNPNAINFDTTISALSHFIAP